MQNTIATISDPNPVRSEKMPLDWTIGSNWSKT
jgi:hypothetical protein